MRVTKTNPIPEEKINEIFLPYYIKDNLALSLKKGGVNPDEQIRNRIKESIFDDYGFDVFSVFVNPENENFLSLNEVYTNRIKDYSNFLISSFQKTVVEDMERKESLEKFKESELFKIICDKTDDNLERCKFLMEIIGENNQDKNSLNFGNSSLDDNQIKTRRSSDDDNKKKTQNSQSSINKRLDLVSEFSNKLLNKTELEKLKKSSKSDKNLEELEKILRSQNLSGKEKGSVFNKMTQVIKNLDFSEYYSLNLGNNNSLVNTFTSTVEVESSNLPIDGFRMSKIKKSEQITRASICEMAMDDDLFYGKYLNGDLIIKDYLRKRKISQAFYVLLDVSGSMHFARETFARSVTKELLKRVVSGKAKYFLRMFDESPYSLLSATNKEEAKEIDNLISTQAFSGGGTDIQNAIDTAVRDIKRDKKKFEDIDILLITDGEDSINLKKEDMKGITLHTFLLNENYSKTVEEDYKKVKQLPESQKRNVNGIRSLILHSDNFNIVNPVEEMSKNNKLIELAVDMDICSLSSYK